MYKMIKETMNDDLLGEYVTYGIESKEAGIHISDVSLNAEKLGAFIMVLNKGMLSPIHLYDLVEDNINDLI